MNDADKSLKRMQEQLLALDKAETPKKPKVQKQEQINVKKPKKEAKKAPSKAMTDTTGGLWTALAVQAVIALVMIGWILWNR